MILLNQCKSDEKEKKHLFFFFVKFLLNFQIDNFQSLRVILETDTLCLNFESICSDYVIFLKNW